METCTYFTQGAGPAQVGSTEIPLAAGEGTGHGIQFTTPSIPFVRFGKLPNPLCSSLPCRP